MKIETAIKQIQKEADFLGLPFLETMQEIQKLGPMVFCERTIDAYRAVMYQGRMLFEEVE
jgi:hypothetical protein